MAKTFLRSRVADDDDFVAWLEEQAALARARRTAELDLDHIAEELEALGRSERRELESHLQQVLLHLLKLGYSPDQRPRRGWPLTLDEQRDAIDRLLRDSPSLGSLPAEALDDCYRRVHRRLQRTPAARRPPIPEACPFAVEQVLDVEFVPESE
jgi:hypothetical protein